MSEKKNLGLWWKSLLAGISLSILALAFGLIGLFAEKPEPTVYMEFNTGDEVEFELKERVTMWLEETNRGLGSSPGTIRDPEDTIRLYGPDGQQIPLSKVRLGDKGSSKGTFVAPGAGTYKLVADSVGRSESYGRLRGIRPYSIYRTICDISFFYALPLGIGLFLLGLVLGIIRGIRKLMEGGLEESSI